MLVARDFSGAALRVAYLVLSLRLLANVKLSVICAIHSISSVICGLD